VPGKLNVFLRILAIVPILGLLGAPVSLAQSASSILSGSVKSSDGKPLEGVGVSARAGGEKRKLERSEKKLISK